MMEENSSHEVLLSIQTMTPLCYIILFELANVAHVHKLTNKGTFFLFQETNNPSIFYNRQEEKQRRMI